MKRLIAGLMAFWGVCLCQTNLQATVWADIRDGVVYIKNESPLTVISVSWKNAWISESQADHIYLQKPDGSLQAKYILQKENTPGHTNVNLGQVGIYRLEVAGANFRNITVSVPAGVKTMFSPVKVHKSISLPRREALYFKVPENHEFTFNAKNYSGVRGFSFTTDGMDELYQLKCKKHQRYNQFDSVAVDSSTVSAVWKVTWQGQGKVSLWVDNIPNLFAVHPEDFFNLPFPATQTGVTIFNEVVGHTPLIGVAFPFEYLPEESLKRIEKWNPTTSNHYVFLDYLQRRLDSAIDFKKYYEQKYNIKQNNAIFGLSNRKYVFQATDKNKQCVINYLEKKGHADSTTYYSIADEPNLNYPSYGSYSKVFGALAHAIKTHENPQVRKTLLAIPQSSRFLNGPTIKGAEKRIGVDWAEKLIDEYGQYIDAISWHEWLVRDLIDTGRYREAVERADRLAESYQDRFHKRPALIIGQTNISSGSALSKYENETFFASLWWASVVINSSLPGKLDQLTWFKAVDDGVYRKGLLSVKDGDISEKPVSRAMEFINRHLGHWVIKVDCETPEVDILGTLSFDKKQLLLLGVNKSKRLHKLVLKLPQEYTQGSLNRYVESGSTQQDLYVKDQSIEMAINKETIFALRLEKE